MTSCAKTSNVGEKNGCLCGNSEGISVQKKKSHKTVCLDRV